MRPRASAVRPRRASYLRAGRLVPKRPRGLRARSVRLAPGGIMDWHSTREREELLIVLSGTMRVQVARANGTTAGIRLRQGQTLFLPKATRHRVMNRTRATTDYIYVTGAA